MADPRFRDRRLRDDRRVPRPGDRRDPRGPARRRVQPVGRRTAAKIAGAGRGRVPGLRRPRRHARPSRASTSSASAPRAGPTSTRRSGRRRRASTSSSRSRWRSPSRAATRSSGPATRPGVRLCTIFPSRFSPANLALKAAIDDGPVRPAHPGRHPRQVVADARSITTPASWRGTWDLDGGGALMNQAIHNVDLLQWLMGEVAAVQAMTATLAHERIEVEDTAVAALRFRNGALGVIEAATGAYPGLLKRTEIHGDARLGPGRAGRRHLLDVPRRTAPRTPRSSPRRGDRHHRRGAATPGRSATPATATSSPTSSGPSTPGGPPGSTAARGARPSRSSGRSIDRPGPGRPVRLPDGRRPRTGPP